jgi:hypothetical protein
VRLLGETLTAPILLEHMNLCPALEGFAKKPTMPVFGKTLTERSGLPRQPFAQ